LIILKSYLKLSLRKVLVSTMYNGYTIILKGVVMELQSVNNPAVNDLSNSTLNTVGKSSVTEKIEELNKNAVSVSINSGTIQAHSDLATILKNQINNISAASSVENKIDTQVQTLDDLSATLDKFREKISTQEEIQPDLEAMMAKYNIGATSISETLRKLEDLNGESHTYFDGAAGAIPIGIDMIDNAMATMRKELASTLEKVAELNNSFKELAQGAIKQEVEATKTESPFKEMDFGKESADFSSTNYSNVAGSVVSSQANASQLQAMKLLS
jgi:flagellin-like hook-associated protein FlgL